MTAKIGVSLPDATYERAVAAVRAGGGSLSGLIDDALRAELARRELADHVAMLADAEDDAEDPEHLDRRARARTDGLRAWKNRG